MIKPSCSTFRVIKANVLGVRIFRIFTVVVAAPPLADRASTGHPGVRMLLP